MRHDMKTVVHDVYRHGRSLVLKPGRPSRSADSMPSREGMRRRYQVAWGRSMKEHREHFVALRRYLEKQVGRPWNDVYREIRQQFDSRSRSSQRVLEKVRWWVTSTDLFVKDGEVRQACQYRGPVRAQGLYVHPVSGLLMVSDAGARKPDYFSVG